MNPFGSPSESIPPPPIPPPPQHETPPYPSSSHFIQSSSPPLRPPSTIYGGLSHTTYEIPPPLSFHDNSGHPSAKGKNCNPCNKVPWIPINTGFSHSGDVTAPQLSELPIGDYPPPRNGEASYDAHYAASQGSVASSFSSVSPSFSGQDGSFVGPSSNPHLYAGALPPLYNAGDFNYPVQTGRDGSTDYLAQPSGSANNALTGNGSNFNGGQSTYPFPSNPSSPGGVYQELGYNNAGTSNGGFSHFPAHNDLSSSGTQMAQQGYENTAIHQNSPDSANHQTSFGSSVILNQQLSGAPNNGVFYDVTGPNAPLDNFLDNSSQIDQNPPNSYGISGFERNNYEHRYNDLSIAKDSHASSSAPDGSSAKIENSIHYQQSLLLDFTHKGESRTDSSPIPTSNVIAHFESVGTTLAPGNFGTRQGDTSTESYFSANHAPTITPPRESKIDIDVKQNIGSDSKTLRSQDVSYIPPSGQAGFLWSDVPSTTSHDTETNLFWNPTAKSYDDVEAEEVSNQNVDSKNTTFANEEGAKRNKKVTQLFLE